MSQEKRKVVINGKNLTFENVIRVARHGAPVEIATSGKDAMKRARDFVLEIVAKEKPVYGINTGFGALADKYIEKKDLAQLQYNLIRSHCTGVGEFFNTEITRAIMLLRANCLASGFSGVNPYAVELLTLFLNNQIHPLVPSQGSVGASGDLAPLSHVALCLIGEGEVLYKEEKRNSGDVLKELGIAPLELGPKDGLALINGTAVMTALGVLAIDRMEIIVKLADVVASMTLEGVRGTLRAFDQKISFLKPHPGQLECTTNLKLLVTDSEIKESHRECNKVQDPYSLRCVPQVHGACRQTLRHAKEVFQCELNAVTDNPLIFVDEKDVISGGNFHGEALSFAMDYLCMGLAELANISERRIEKMMNPVFSDLPAFLVADSGLNSGLMIAHVTAAALVSENKIYCHPASVDSVPTSTDKEDHVSMGVTAGLKLWKVVENVKNVFAIEFLCASQALEFHRPLKSSSAIEAAHTLIRQKVAPLEQDRTLHQDIAHIAYLIDSGILLSEVENITGELK